jgi:hypothetical protein
MHLSVGLDVGSRRLCEDGDVGGCRACHSAGGVLCVQLGGLEQVGGGGPTGGCSANEIPGHPAS